MVVHPKTRNVLAHYLIAPLWYVEHDPFLVDIIKVVNEICGNDIKKVD